MYTAIIIIALLVSLSMYYLGYVGGQITANQKVIKYCKEKPMNLTEELMRDMYPNVFWIDPDIGSTRSYLNTHDVFTKEKMN